jgi:hypothetical protein
MRIPGAEVRLASTLVAATRAILSDPPDLVLSSMALPDGDNLQLFSALTSPELDVPTTFMSRCLRRFREHLGHVLRAPNPREALERGLQCDCGDFTRRPLALGLADAIALAALSDQAVSLELVQNDDIVGVVIVADGQVRSALDAEGDGFDAVVRLLQRRRPALLTCRAAERGGWQTAVQIAIDWRSLLLEHAGAGWLSDLNAAPDPEDRRDDGLLRAPLCDDDDRLADAEARFDDLLERGLDAVLDRRLEDARSIFAAAQEIRPEPKTPRRWPVSPRCC